MLENVQALRDDLQDREEQRNVCFGTVDSWIIYQLTDKPATTRKDAIHARGHFRTHGSNAARWLFMDLGTAQWDSDLIHDIGTPYTMCHCHACLRSSIPAVPILVSAAAAPASPSTYRVCAFPPCWATNKLPCWDTRPFPPDMPKLPMDPPFVLDDEYRRNQAIANGAPCDNRGVPAGTGSAHSLCGGRRSLALCKYHSMALSSIANDPHGTRGDGTLGHAAEPWLVLCTRLLRACLPLNGDPMRGPVGGAGRLGMTRDMCVCVVLPSKHRPIRPVKSGKPLWRVVAATATAALVTPKRSTLVCVTQPSLEVTCLQVDGGGTEHKLITISGRSSPCSSHPTCRRHQGTCQSRCRLLRRSGL